MNDTITFFIPGIPAPGGSKRFVGFAKPTGRAILIDAAGQRNKNWRSICADIGMQAMSGRDVLEGPLAVTMGFFMPRPKGHYGAKGLKPNAPAFPISRPDVLKISRSTEDALTGVVWRDDSQTISLGLCKVYAEDGKCGCQVSITPL